MNVLNVHVLRYEIWLVLYSNPRILVCQCIFTLFRMKKVAMWFYFWSNLTVIFKLLNSTVLRKLTKQTFHSRRIHKFNIPNLTHSACTSMFRPCIQRWKLLQCKITPSHMHAAHVDSLQIQLMWAHSKADKFGYDRHAISRLDNEESEWISHFKYLVLSSEVLSCNPHWF